MAGDDRLLVPRPICEGTGVGRAAPPGTPCGYCTGEGRVPQALVSQVRAAHRLARTVAWVRRAAAAWRREVDGQGLGPCGSRHIKNGNPAALSKQLLQADRAPYRFR